MRVSLDTGAITSLDQNRGIGVYAEQLIKRLPQYFKVVNKKPQLTHCLVFKLFLRSRQWATPTVVTIHDLIPLKYPQAYPPGLRGRLKWWRQKLKLRQAAGIITDSQASKQDIIKFTGIDAERIHVVYLAADEIFKPVKAVNQLALPDKFVLYVVDFNWNKNVVSLTKACLELHYPLVVVGRQAVASGCPVLSSGKGSLPEITGKAALVFNQTNLKLVWQNMEWRRKLVQVGLIQAKKFSWEKTVMETVKVYEKIITDRSNH